MDCVLCGQKLESESLKNHIKTHCYDKQYGVRADDLAAALADLTIRVTELEKSRKKITAIVDGYSPDMLKAKK